MEGGDEQQQRRGSWSTRALGKLRSAMRRGSSSKNESVPTLANQQHPALSNKAEGIDGTNDDNVPSVTTATALTTNEPPTEVIEQPSTTTAAAATTANVTTRTEAPLIVDDGLPSEDDEPLLPVVTNRTGVDPDRARLLFEKYGLKYEARKRSLEEPPSKMRRVEKPVHIRTHWTCHECDGKISRDKVCAACGHRRCGQCSRMPAKRIREALESAKLQKKKDDADFSKPSVHEQDDLASPTQTTATPLVKDENEETSPTTDRVPTQYHYKPTLTLRPNSSSDLILRPKTQIIRRSCHKCNTPFLPADKTSCDTCQHVRCTLCPRHPAKASKWPHGGAPGDVQPPEDEVRMYQGVQRVYKKPRQRVRWTCDRCQTLFVEGGTCRSCGHSRCKDCLRSPPQRPPPTPDPSIVQSVSERLAAYIVDQRSQIAAAAS